MSRHCFKHLIGISSISDHDFIYWALYQSFNMHDVILSSNHPNKVGTFIKPPLEIRKVKCGEVKWWGSHGKWEGKAGLEAGTMWHQGLNHFVKVSSNVVLRVVTQPPAYVWWHTFNSRCYDQRFCWTWLSLCPLGRLVCKLLYACELRSWWDPPANVAEGGSQLWTAWSPRPGDSACVPLVIPFGGTIGVCENSATIAPLLIVLCCLFLRWEWYLLIYFPLLKKKSFIEVYFMYYKIHLM